jgi:hypothetical protein
MDPRESTKFSENLGKRAAETLAMIRQAFGEEGVSRTQGVQTHRRPKKTRQVKNQFNSMLIIIFDTKRIVHKQVFLAGQTVPYYCYVLRRLRANVRRLRPKLWGHKNWLLQHDKHCPTLSFSPGNFFLPKTT